MLAATKVILLFDPEYLTAANYRKQRFLTSASRMHLLNRLSDTTSWQGVKALDQELNFEMSFLDSILTSPLHRQTKSPTLWYHRLWIVADLILPLRPNGTSDDLLRTKNLVEHEICTVFKAAERHPHNYYAWQYLRRLLETLSGDNVHEFFATKEFDVGPNVHSDMPTAVMSWCLAHPSDVSGWSCLSYLIRSPWIDPYPVKVDEIVSHVMKFVISIRWTGESVWNFLAYAPPQATERFRDILEDFTRAVEGDDKARHVYKALGCMRKGWCNREPGGWR